MDDFEIKFNFCDNVDLLQEVADNVARANARTDAFKNVDLHIDIDLVPEPPKCWVCETELPNFTIDPDPICSDLGCCRTCLVRTAIKGMELILGKKCKNVEGSRENQ